MRGGGLSLFSGAGGFDLGACLAGLRVRLATDANRHALDALECSGVPDWLLDGDIDDLMESGSLREAWGKGAPRIIFGGPPCTGFSHAGFWLDEKRNGNDPAVHLIQRYLDAIAEFRPEAFVIENVPGLAFKTHAGHLQGLINRARRLGYRVSGQILDASQFGIPQARRRLFLVGCKSVRVDLGTWPPFPCRTAGWALKSIQHSVHSEPDEQLRGKYRELLRNIPPGNNYIHFTRRGPGRTVFKYRGRYWSFLLKIDPRAPSPTIPAQRVTFNGPFHWSSRHLRIGELARLQGFPDEISWSEDLSAARLEIGNAVPPLLGAAVIWRVRQALGDAPMRDLPDALRAAQEEDTTYEQLSSVMWSQL